MQSIVPPTEYSTPFMRSNLIGKTSLQGYTTLCAIASNLAMRCPIGGCVLNNVAKPPPENGFKMKRWAVAGVA